MRKLKDQMGGSRSNGLVILMGLLVFKAYFLDAILALHGATNNGASSAGPPADAPPLPTCQELMRRPSSPYADGSFLTRRTTEVCSVCSRVLSQH